MAFEYLEFQATVAYIWSDKGTSHMQRCVISVNQSEPIMA